ncbi:helix-turn-helix domain-containing protein [Halovenus salina]|uniref:Helix-turn-helix domain-containing protein n=1 Tax=Halovenus salina TaxID=1510225 RepID=A0ABD5VV21_9EURY
MDQFDEGLIDLLAWILETETRARIYISLRSAQDQTSDEIAERTGLYPSTVREALASLHEDDIVTRGKRQNAGAGNNPYEYSAIPPSDLVGEVVDDIQHHLNAVFNLDNYMDRSKSSENGSDPVTITVTEEDSAESTSDGNDSEDNEDDE